ncbi:MAG: hypothetical protein QOG35_2906, partial [Solirubrobacteraceae bacterium]|nr:hypothetical protein [Solirubrobacteraceae bacterium]
SGGFASPTAARLLGEADLVLAVGATLNVWTTRHGALVAGTRVIQVDVDEEAIGGHLAVDVGVLGDARATAEALVAAVEAGGADGAARPPALARAIRVGRWQDVPYEESTAPATIDPRTLTIALDELLPDERTVAVDSGHFMGWPAMYLRVPDAAGFVFAQAFQCVGLGLANAIGAAVARPDRLTVAAIGDGGALLALGELETLGRLRLPVLVVIYNDAAYGAEVHHFRPMGQAVDAAQFPDTDFAALARAAGCEGATVRSVTDLDAVRGWLARRDGPLVVDAKVDPDVCAEWLEEAFRGH